MNQPRSGSLTLYLAAATISALGMALFAHLAVAGPVPGFGRAQIQLVSVSEGVGAALALAALVWGVVDVFRRRGGALIASLGGLVLVVSIVLGFVRVWRFL